MKLRIAAVIGLLVVGLGAVVFAMGGPGLLVSTPASTYLTGTAAVANVVKAVAATGKIQAVSNYAIRFGQAPVSTSASGTTSGGGGGGAGTTWPVTAVNVTVGQAVKKGDVLATADTTYANAQLAVAQSNLDAATTKLTTDQNGADDATKATLQDTINQATQSVSNAKQNQTITASQNALTLQGAQDSADAAQAKFDADTAASAAANVISADQTALTTALNKLASTKLQIQQSNTNAAQSVSNAALAVTAAQNNYTLKTSPTSAATIAGDQAALLTAQTALTAAQTAIKYANLVAPDNGVVVSVNLTVGVNAPAGDAVTLQSAALTVVASASETDVSSLQVGMAATILTSASNTSLTGKLQTISPVASGGSGASVVTYQIILSLDSVPAGILSGMSAQITIQLGQASNVIAVPAAALYGTSGNYYVRVMGANGTPANVQVQVGLVTTSLVEIKSGLTPGEVVVTGTVSQRTTTTTNTTQGAGALGGFGGAGPAGVVNGRGGATGLGQ